MSDNKLMSTAPGGESTQYESINTVNQPTEKQGGHLGEPETEDASKEKKSQDQKDSGPSLNESVAESGMGGYTTTSSGSADADAAADGYDGRK